jgi:hypothetical protein
MILNQLLLIANRLYLPLIIITPAVTYRIRIETIIASQTEPDQYVVYQPLGMGHCGSNWRR